MLPSSFVVCLSFYTRRRHFLSKALVYYCFLVFRRIGEYISLDLFCFVSLTSSCLFIPRIMCVGLSLFSLRPDLFRSPCLSAPVNSGKAQRDRIQAPDYWKVHTYALACITNPGAHTGARVHTHPHTRAYLLPSYMDVLWVCHTMGVILYFLQICV